MAFLQQNKDREVGSDVGRMFDRPVSTLLELDMKGKKRLEIYNRNGRHAEGINVRMDGNLFSGRSEVDHSLFNGRSEIDRSIIMISESPKNVLEQEKRIRREIANSNERRRMQGINAGIQVLLQLLPQRGEKLSKAAILQSAAELVNKLENERSLLIEQNRQLCKRMASSLDILNIPSPKKRRRETSVDCSTSPQSSIGVNASESDKREMMDLKRQLDMERAKRMQLQEKIWTLETHLKQFDIRSNSADHLHSRDQNVTEDPAKHSVKVPYPDEVPHSPESEIETHNANNDHHYGTSVTCETSSSPISENPRDLFVSDNGSLLQCADGLLMADATPIPGISESQGPQNNPSFDLAPQQAGYIVNSTSKQNLESIVEAIKLVEGPHIFHNPKSPESSGKINECEGRHQSVTPTVSNRKSAIHQVIPNSLCIQTRPGVIVSNHS